MKEPKALELSVAIGWQAGNSQLNFDCTVTFKQAPRPVGNFGANRISLNSTPNDCTPHRVTFWNGGVPFAIWGCGRKSETKFVKQNWEVVCKCGFRFCARVSE